MPERMVTRAEIKFGPRGYSARLDVGAYRWQLPVDLIHRHPLLVAALEALPWADAVPIEGTDALVLGHEDVPAELVACFEAYRAGLEAWPLDRKWR